ncbi:SdiA-regulated domain-containing protein [Chryseobacterium proteolyticum]|uniref:SdiA-regulated domain-containing protein n=1 Tax=Chryseobacterium proteolyticum TaxID=118127 RepID=UPI0039833050
MKMYIFCMVTSLLLMGCNPKNSEQTKEDTLKVEFSLPKKLKEVSGITLSPDKKTIWAIEDQGNKNRVYGLDTKGAFVSDVLVENAENNDWEEITSDRDGNIYIGDFGNNDNDRRNLSILKIDLKDASQTTTKVTQKTSFHYEGQTEFPPKKSNLLYDCEAFVEMNGNFYLFTKNRSKGFDGSFLIFRVPNKAGDFEAKLMGKFKLDGKYADAAITAASINSKGDQIVLLNHKNVRIVTGFTPDDFSKIKVQKISLHHNSQKEAVTFVDDKNLLIADEKDKKDGGNVYLFTLKP